MDTCGEVVSIDTSEEEVEVGRMENCVEGDELSCKGICGELSSIVLVESEDMLMEDIWLETSEEADGGVEVGSVDEVVSLDTLWLETSEGVKDGGVKVVGGMDKVSSLDSSEGTPVEGEELSSKGIC